MKKIYFILPLVVLGAGCGSNEPSKDANTPPTAVNAKATPIAPEPSEPAEVPVPIVAQTLEGNWVPFGDTCTPKGGVSETALWFSPADKYSGETISGAGWTCTFPGKNIVSGQQFSGTVSCGFGEGIEGNPKLSVSIGDDGKLNVKQQSTKDTGVDGGGEIEGFSGTYKKCSGSLTSPY